jgi:HAE1 family hydrophobic/amphiphilic exporter-1/multidrug efflux pump
MTSLAFIFGVLPLAFSSGAGAGSRHSIGTGVVGGMLLATFVATFFIPLFYVWIVARFGEGKRAPGAVATQTSPAPPLEGPGHA